MKHLRKFGSKAEMDTALANSTIGVIGLAYESGSTVIKSVTPPPAPVTKYTVTVGLYDDEWNVVTWGTVSGNEGTFANGSVVTVTVTPIAGKEVREWWTTESMIAQNTNTCDIVVNGDTEIWVLMGNVTIRHNLTVNVLPAEYAAYCSVSGAGLGVVLDGASPTLTASYSSPYAIDHWEIDGVRVAGNATNYTLSPVHSDVTVDAYFTYFPQDRTITVASNNPSYGTVQIENYQHQTSNTSLAIRECTNATLTATPNTGYQFEGWYYNNEKVSSDAVYTFTLPEFSTDRTYTANFILQGYTVTVHVTDDSFSDVTWGSVSGNEGTFANGTTVHLTSTASTGYEIKAWYNIDGDVISTSSTCDVVVSGNTEVWAVFGPETIRHTLYVTVNPAEYYPECNVTGAGVKLEGESPTLTATFSPIYSVNHWEINGTTVAYNAATYTVPPMHGDVTVDVFFNLIPQE